MNVEELGGTPVEANALAFVELGFAVVGRYTLLLACSCEAREQHRIVSSSCTSVSRATPGEGPGMSGEDAAVAGSWFRNIPINHLREELHLGFDSRDLLCRRGLWSSESEERHVDSKRR